MIKVERINKPKELTDDVQKQLTDEFKKDKKKQVWNKSYIRRELLKECHGKCVYCESLIGEGHKEMHVDHFHYKDKYKDEVVLWKNLNPSCPHCNKSKSSHDTYVEPIINPFEQNPQEYFCIKHYRYYSKNSEVEEIVRRTIDVLELNNTENVVMLRFKIGEALIQEIQDIYEFAIENKDILCSKTVKRNRVLRGCRNILKKGTKDAEYAAFMSSIIMGDSYYKKLRELLKELNLWDDELQELDEEVDKIKLQRNED